MPPSGGLGRGRLRRLSDGLATRGGSQLLERRPARPLLRKCGITQTRGEDFTRGSCEGQGEGDTACVSHARAVAPALSTIAGGRCASLWASPRPRRLRKLILWACGVGGMKVAWGDVVCWGGAGWVGGGGEALLPLCEWLRPPRRSTHRSKSDGGGAAGGGGLF